MDRKQLQLLTLTEAHKNELSTRVENTRTTLDIYKSPEVVTNAKIRLGFIQSGILQWRHAVGGQHDGKLTGPRRIKL